MLTIDIEEELEGSPKQIEKLTDEEYNKVGNYKDGITKDTVWRCSEIKDIYKSNLYDIIYNKRELKGDALTLGSAIHTKILEPEEFNKRYSTIPSLDNTGIEFLDKNMLEAIEIAEKSVNNKYRALIEKAEHKEVCLFGNIGDHKTKVKADIIVSAGGKRYFIDLKTTSAFNVFNLREIGNSVENYNYDLQASFYLDTANSIGLNVDGFLFLFVNAKDGSCQLFETPQILLERGRQKYTKAFEQIESFQKSGHFMQSGFLESLPVQNWIVREMER